MPSASDILRSLTLIANDGLAGAVVWHIAIAAVLGALALGWRPTVHVDTKLVAAPLASVALFAIGYGNLFNGLVFAIAAAATLALGIAAPPVQPPLGPPWARVLGAALIGYGLVYPHFLLDRPLVAYLVAAPTGLLPCPTLAVALGFALAAGGLGRRVDLLLAALGTFYALFGVLRLGVALDLGLLVGAAGLALLRLAPAVGADPTGSRAPARRRSPARPAPR